MCCVYQLPIAVLSVRRIDEGNGKKISFTIVASDFYLILGIFCVVYSSSIHESAVYLENCKFAN